MKLKLLTLLALAAVVLAVGYVLQFPHTLEALGALVGPAVFGMIQDERTEFADALAIPTATGLSLLGDVIDTAPMGPGGTGLGRNLGGGKRLYLVIQIDTAVTSGAAASVDFRLVSDAQAAIAVDGSASVHAQTAVVAKAALVAGFVFILPLPPEGSVPYERYLGVISNVTTTALTAGKVNAFLVTDVKQWKALPDGIAP